MSTFKSRASLVLVAAFAGLLLVAAPASAGQSPYPPNPEDRTFATSPGGWVGSSTVTGLGPLCIAPLTCPTIDNIHVATGGIQSDGHLRHEVGGLAEVATEVVAEFESPTFTYRGSAGDKPDQVLFTMARRTNAAALVQVLNEERYSVFLENKGAQASIALIEDVLLTDTEDWQIIEPVTVDRGLLSRGGKYSIRIVTEFQVPVGVIPSGTFDYDNVLLVAFDKDTTGPGSAACARAKNQVSRAESKLKRSKRQLRNTKRKLKRADGRGENRLKTKIRRIERRINRVERKIKIKKRKTKKVC